MQGFFSGLHIGQGKLSFNHLNIGNRIDAASDVDDVVVFKAAHHVDDGVGFADV